MSRRNKKHRHEPRPDLELVEHLDWVADVQARERRAAELARRKAGHPSEVDKLLAKKKKKR